MMSHDWPFKVIIITEAGGLRYCHRAANDLGDLGDESQMNSPQYLRVVSGIYLWCVLGVDMPLNSKQVQM